MSKYYSPRDYDCIGFGGSRRWVPISDEEKRKRAGKGKSKKLNMNISVKIGIETFGIER